MICSGTKLNSSLLTDCEYPNCQHQWHDADAINRMIAIAAVLMTVVHPAFFFPEISSRYQKRQGLAKGEKDEEAGSASPSGEMRSASSSE